MIFLDAEPSNWTFDQVRQQYYWHRFFHHQPDLNYDNPEVVDAMLDVVRFWLDLGIDGFRLDAVAYLYKAEGTACENLPETHALLRRIRAEIDTAYPGRVLLAEVNQWPADVVEYFGDGDECHMCFHFPLMPRMFMAIRREQRFPITEILAQTPAIPDGCQWGIFLRNHDELTLEMVTDDERDYMYAEYARDPRMRKNLGIRRRLAPLVENDRRVAELLHALLLSLPGSAGALLRRRDLDGRQHLPRRPRHGADADAVDARPQRRLLAAPTSPSSYLAAADGPRLRLSRRSTSRRSGGTPPRSCTGCGACWRCAASTRVFATGALEVLPADNPSVLAYVRQARTVAGAGDLAGDWTGDEVVGETDGGSPAGMAAATSVLCVSNLSRFAQPAELSLGRWEGCTPIELLGTRAVPAGDLRAVLGDACAVRDLLARAGGALRCLPIR